MTAQRISALLTRRGFELEASLPPGGVVEQGAALFTPMYTGICGSDIHVYRQRADLQVPWILGHEVSGVTPGTGARVVLHPTLNCAACRNCLLGRDHVCSKGRFVGAANYAGSFAGYLVVPMTAFVSLPDSVVLRDATLVEPLAVAFQTASHVRSDAETFLILGAGPIGLLTALILRHAFGREHIALIEPSAWRRAMAARLGFRIWDQPAVATAIGSLGVNGVDVVLDCSNAPESNVDLAIHALNASGLLQIVGISHEESIVAPQTRCREKALTIRFVRRCTHEDTHRAVHFLTEHAAVLRQLITDEFHISEVAEAFVRAANPERNYLKMVIAHQ